MVNNGVVLISIILEIRVSVDQIAKFIVPVLMNQSI